MSSKTWKRKEERLAKMFGSTRRPLSGGNSKTGRDDSLHPRLFLDSKYGEHAPIFRTYYEIREKARSERQERTPLLCLFQRDNVEGCLFVIHSGDFYTIAEEYLAARGLIITEPLADALGVAKQSPPTKEPRQVHCPLREEDCPFHTAATTSRGKGENERTSKSVLPNPRGRGAVRPVS